MTGRPEWITRARFRVMGVAVAAVLLCASTLDAQTRVILPEGTVLTVRTQNIIDSRTANVGDVFETAVTDPVSVDGFTVIPANSRIHGVVTFVQPADRRRSGVVGVDFDRLTVPGGRSVSIDGKLTSTDAAERRQIEAQAGEVVLVGGRGGIGAAIASGRGDTNDPLSSFLGALGGLLSEGSDVRVPAGTTLAVQLEQGLALTVQGAARTRVVDAFTIYTSSDMIRAAQQELKTRGYYRGPINGQLTDATQVALFEFQIDEGILATGNLDGRTAQQLGLSVSGSLAALTPQEASLVRRSAEAVAARYRDTIQITTTGRLNPRRAYSAAELELWFALGAFAHNAALYEQVVKSSGNVEGTALAGEALVAAAERVDAARAQARPPTRVASAWDNIRQELSTIEPEYLGP